MGVRVNAPGMRELVDDDAELEQLATGCTFTEGPLWHPDGYLLFSDMPGDVRRRWDERDGVREIANPSNKGNGMTWDLDGRLIVCEHVTSSVVRMDPDGTGSGSRDARDPPRRTRAQQPQRRRREVRRRDLLHRPHLRAHARVRHRARAGPRLPGRLPDRPGRRRPAAARRRFRPAQRPVLHRRRDAALRQRHRPRAHPSLRRRRTTARWPTAASSPRASARATSRAASSSTA